MRKRNFLANMIIIALSTAFLAHFGFIAYYGQIVISEPHTVILALEMIGLTSFVVFASFNLAR